MNHNDYDKLRLTGEDLNYGAFCDHTVLKAYTTENVVKAFCDEAKKYHAAAVCVNPYNVPLVRKELAGTGIKCAAVIGFPLGANKTCVKAFEAQEAVKDGADELDMVINVGALRDGKYDVVSEDIKAVVEAGKPAVTKVIIETCYLTDEQKVKACQLAKEAGAAFVKTSSGFGTGGATVHDVELMRKTVGPEMGVKASTGIDNREIANAMVKAGADRFGTSKTPQITMDDTTIQSASVLNKVIL